MKTNKGKVFVKRWGEKGRLVNLPASPYTVTNTLGQMHYDDWLTIFGIPLAEEVVYSLRVNATVKPYVREQGS